MMCFAPRRLDQIRDQFCGDRLARVGDPVLPGVAEMRDHDMNVFRETAFQRVDDQKQFKKIGVDIGGRGRNDEAVAAADGLADLHIFFAAREFFCSQFSRLHSGFSANISPEFGGGSGRENFEKFEI